MTNRNESPICIAIILWFLSGVVFADEIRIRPNILNKNQRCFDSTFRGYVSAFSKNNFKVNTILAKCGTNRPVPTGCLPYVVSKGRAPVELSDRLKDFDTFLIEKEFVEDEVVHVTFNGHVTSNCQPLELNRGRGGFTPTNYKEEDIISITPIRLSSENARSLGIRGNITADEDVYSLENTKTESPSKPGDTISIQTKVSGYVAFKGVQKGQKIPLIANLKSSNTPLLFEGVVKEKSTNELSVQISEGIPVNQVTLASEESSPPPIKTGPVRLELSANQPQKPRWSGRLKSSNDPMEFALIEINTKGTARIVKASLNKSETSQTGANEIIFFVRVPN